MILSRRPPTRLLAQFDLLIDHLRAMYRKANPKDADFESDEEEAGKVSKYVWGDNGHLDLIDRFLDERDARLSSADQRAIPGFKDGLCDTFAYALIGVDAFILVENVFTVCGIEYEVDEAAVGLPRIARTLLFALRWPHHLRDGPRRCTIRRKGRGQDAPQRTILHSRCHRERLFHTQRV